METYIKTLTEKEVEQQLKNVAKYHLLLSKELNYKDLADLDNISKYMAAIKFHIELVIKKQIELPKF